MLTVSYGVCILSEILHNDFTERLREKKRENNPNIKWQPAYAPGKIAYRHF